MTPLFEQQAFEALDRLRGFSSQKAPLRVAVGVSGGADSVALALILSAYVGGVEPAGEVIALTVDHGLRPDSTQEAQAVGRLLAPWGIPHKILTWQGPKPQTRIQEKARLARHRLLRDYCRRERIDWLFLAHHLDDQEETLLMRYLRRSRLSGLSGMSAVSTAYDWPGGRVIRPFLSFRKHQLETYLRRQGASWIEDPSNKNPLFERVRLRRALKTYRPWILSSLPAFGRLRAAYERLMNTLMDQLVTLHPEAYCDLHRGGFDKLPAPFQADILERVLMSVGGHFYPPKRHNLEAFCQKLGASKGAQLSFGGCLLRQKKRVYQVIREPAAVAGPCSLQEALRGGPAFLWDGRFQLSLGGAMGSEDVQEIKTLHQKATENAGLTLKALGPDGLDRIRNAVPRLKDLPSKILETLPAFWVGDQVVALPLIGYFAGKEWLFLDNSTFFTPPNPLYREFVVL